MILFNVEFGGLELYESCHREHIINLYRHIIIKVR